MFLFYYHILILTEYLANFPLNLQFAYQVYLKKHRDIFNFFAILFYYLSLILFCGFNSRIGKTSTNQRFNTGARFFDKTYLHGDTAGGKFNKKCISYFMHLAKIGSFFFKSKVNMKLA